MILDKVFEVFSHITSDISNMSKLDIIYYFSYYTKLQTIIRNFDQNIVESIEGQILSPASVCLKEFEDCLHAIKFADACYGKKFTKIYKGKVRDILCSIDFDKEFLDLVNGTKENLIYSNWTSKTFAPAFCIYLDDKTETVNVCFRGSTDPTDFLTDLICCNVSVSLMECNGSKYLRINGINDPTGAYSIAFARSNTKEFSETKFPEESSCKELCKGVMHAGVLNAGLEIFGLLIKMLKDVYHRSKYNNYRLFLTGHSLGGGMTCQIGFLLTLHPLIMSNGKVKEFLCYGVGSPPIASKEFRKHIKDYQTTIVNGIDCIPRTCFGSLKDVSRVLKELQKIQNNETLPQIYKNMDLNTIEPELRSRILAVYVKIRGSMKCVKYSMPGKAYYFEHRIGVKKSLSVMEVSKVQSFHQLLFVEYHIWHHFPNLYLSYMEQWVKLVGDWNKVNDKCNFENKNKGE